MTRAQYNKERLIGNRGHWHSRTKKKNDINKTTTTKKCTMHQGTNKQQQEEVK